MIPSHDHSASGIAGLSKVEIVKSSSFNAYIIQINKLKMSKEELKASENSEIANLDCQARDTDRMALRELLVSLGRTQDGKLVAVDKSEVCPSRSSY
jgi:hypothetical protein